jgi:hypothetical protein
MRVHIFQGEDGLYDFTPQDDGRNLPAEYSPWRPFKSVEMFPDRAAKRIGANEAEVLAAIKRQGYCISDVRIEIAETRATLRQIKTPATDGVELREGQRAVR